MKTYKFKNATIYVHGEINRERLKKSSIQLIKNAHKSKIVKSEVNN